MLKLLPIILLMFISSLYAEATDDSTKNPIVVDTTKTDTLMFDTTGIDVDTLTEAQRVYQEFLSRQAKRKEEQEAQKEVLTYFSFYDSLITTFLHPRLNLSQELKKSFTKDAGDYFKTNPSYFVHDVQQTPSRKVVRPFGLSGDRMNIIVNGTVYSPFEHIVEPDGLVDFNDIPTGLSKDIYVLPGGIGQLFGGEQSIASLVTVPNQPESIEPEIGLFVDKGGYNYAYTRGGYTKLFSDGKEVDLSADYRNTQGIRFNTDDNGKHFTGRTLIPLGSAYYMNASGSTYRRRGSYKADLQSISPYIDRNRTDKMGAIALEKLTNNQTAKYHIGYQYLKQNSNIDREYTGRFNYFGDALHFSRESMFGSKMVKAELTYNSLKYTDGVLVDTEKSGKGSLSIIQKSNNSSLGLIVGTKYNEEYLFLPFSTAVYQKYSDKSFFMFSMSYSEKAPSMHDRNLRYQTANIYPTGVGYADVGNNSLVSEKQLTGSLLYERGSEKNNIRLTITSGFINDGFDWYQADTTTTLGSVLLFSLKNSDITFADFKLKQKFSVAQFLNLSIGGAYHYIDYKLDNNRAYQPEYQVFVGGELHHYWKQKILDLYMYAESIYEGPYKGYRDEILGENIIINTGLALELKKFRFYYIFQNSLSFSRPNPDAFNSIGTYSYYGLSWYFIN